MISNHIKAEHLAGWEHVAEKYGAESVEAYAQERLDRLGADFEGERAADDRAAQSGLFDLALKLSEEKREELRGVVTAMAVEEGLIEPEE